MSANSGIVVHITSGENADWRMALRNILNLYEDESVPTAAEAITVVVNGDAVRFLLASAPEATQISQMAAAGVQINVCDGSLDRLGFASAALADGVSRVPSGVAEVVRHQKRDATYLKLP